MQSMPDARQQSFEELYAPPENFLEIEVSRRKWDVHPYAGIGRIVRVLA